MTHKLRYDGHRWVAPGPDPPVHQRIARDTERKTEDHLIVGILIGLPLTAVLWLVILGLALLVH